MLRVAFTSRFNRGKLADLVGLLSGRNFETRTYEKDIEEASFQNLHEGVMEFINETHFKRFLMIIRSAGFVDKSMIRSGAALNFAYSLYLKLKRDHGNEPRIESWVRRWFVMSVLTGRYSASPESRVDKDIKDINERGFTDVLADREAAELSDTFWEVGLVQGLRTSSVSSPLFKAFLAAQACLGDKGFLSKDITVRDMLTHHGDIHHIFPREFLKKQGYTRGRYNQVANLVCVQQEINIKIGSKNPNDYMAAIFQQSQTGQPIYGVITDPGELAANFQANALPQDQNLYHIDHYEDFLSRRREAMAEKIKHYYQKL